MEMEACIREITTWYISSMQRINVLQKITQEYGISFMQYCILISISSNEKKPSELASELGVEASSISRAIKKLTKKELSTRVIDQLDDTRMVEIRITSIGEEILDKINTKLKHV